jgi:hypothetical protein
MIFKSVQKSASHNCEIIKLVMFGQLTSYPQRMYSTVPNSRREKTLLLARLGMISQCPCTAWHGLSMSLHGLAWTPYVPALLGMVCQYTCTAFGMVPQCPCTLWHVHSMSLHGLAWSLNVPAQFGMFCQ